MRRVIFIIFTALMSLIVNAQHVAKTMEYDGITRKYMQYTPTAVQEGGMPVLFLLHGLGDNCASFSELGFEYVAPNWLIITPEATVASISVMGMSFEIGTAWAAGVGGVDISAYGMALGDIELNADVDDEGFLIALLDSLEANYNVNTDSVFCAGYSMGGFMTNKMGIKHADRIKAIASVSGTIGRFQPFEPVGQLNTLHIHGTSDDMIAYDDANCTIQSFDIGSVGTGAEETVEKWRNHNQCDFADEVYHYEDAYNDGLTFERYDYRNSNDGWRTTFIKVVNGEHDWYVNSRDINYNVEIHKFFTQRIGTSEVESKIDENVILYPNPANDFLVVNAVSAGVITIYDGLSRVVAQKEVYAGENVVDIQALANGLYFVNVNGEVCKVVVSR